MSVLETSNQAIQMLRAKYRDLRIPVPTLHIVLGSGTGAALTNQLPKGWIDQGSLSFDLLPGLPTATVQGHAGIYRFYQHQSSGKVLTFQVGRIHGYEGHSARVAVQPVILPFLAGTRDFILTNAAGSLQEQQKPGSVMLIRDHFNLTGQNPLVGPNPSLPGGLELGTRFPDFTQIYSPELLDRLKPCLRTQNLVVHEGVYLGLLGPSFETPAEIQVFARWGLHAIGMSTVWEAIALKHAGARVAGLSLISNMGCGIGGPQNLSHEALLHESQKAAEKILAAFFELAEAEFTSS